MAPDQTTIPSSSSVTGAGDVYVFTLTAPYLQSGEDQTIAITAFDLVDGGPDLGKDLFPQMNPETGGLMMKPFRLSITCLVTKGSSGSGGGNGMLNKRRKK